MGQKIERAVQTRAAAAGDGMTERVGVPVDDDSGEQVEPCHPEVLSFVGSVADFALAADAQDVLQGVVGLILVQADLGTAPHVRIKPPVDDEECPFDPSDFVQGHCQFVLARAGCELPQ